MFFSERLFYAIVLMMELKEFFDLHPQTALAFSGGTDSAYLLYAACRYAEKVRAYYVKTAFQPAFEMEDAVRLAGELNAELSIVEPDILREDAVTRNGPDRCYECKKRIFGAIAEAAARDGFSVLLDGTNASDDAADRPGMRALKELSVLSPLKLCGLTKADVRRLSREAGLFTWDKPAYACLATRIPTGRPLDERLLKRTEAAEDALSRMGFRDFRIRTLGEAARLQLTERQLPLAIEKRGEIKEKLMPLYEAVLLDLEVRIEQ